MYITDTAQWAKFIFGQTDLGDHRRTKRLVQLTNDMADNVSDSIVKASQTTDKVEGAYRFIRNEKISPEAIISEGVKRTYVKRTYALMKDTKLVLAIQDTTGLTFKHKVTQELGDVSCSKKANSSTRTLYAHSTLMIDAQTEKTIGLGNQHYYHREQKVTGTKEEKQQRAFKDKETYRWKANFEHIKQEMGEVSNVIDICDREADIYEYLSALN